MKNISGQLYMALTGACVIALLVFLIQLMVLNVGGESADPDSIVMGGPPAEGSEDQNGNEGVGNAGNTNTPNPGGGGQQEAIPRPTPEGTRRTIPLGPTDDFATLVIYSDDNLFEYIENEFNWRFEYKASGNAALEISIVYSSPQAVRSDEAEAFLNLKTGGDGAEFLGTHQIRGSSLTGSSVRTEVNNVTYEAWLYHLTASDLAIAFVINYEFIGQRDDLYVVLDSMTTEQG